MAIQFRTRRMTAGSGRRRAIGVGACLLALSGAMSGAGAQAPADPPPADPPPEGAAAAPLQPGDDDMAAELNARQQIKQTFTVTRTINGEVVETDKRTITYGKNDPLRPSEAGTSVVEELIASFNNEVLTRTEAFEEAKLDFVAADSDRDGEMTVDEFAALMEGWRVNAEARAVATSADSARDRQYRAFVDGLDPESSKAKAEARARAKFAFMTGAAATVSRADYVREYLLDFDSMDADGDMLLRGEELMNFRALNTGEALGE